MTTYNEQEQGSRGAVASLPAAKVPDSCHLRNRNSLTVM